MTEPTITFVCAANDYGIIAEPQPAKHVMQDWYRKLPPVDPEHKTISVSGKTVKLCMPFFDALALGFVLPVPFDFSVEVSGGGAAAHCHYRYPKGGILSYHHAHQIKGHPRADRPILKVLTLWAIHTPPGWSCLIVPPLNRPGLPLEVVSGVIDTDTLRTYVLLPCFITLPDGLHDIAKGTPLAQVIPFLRVEHELMVRAETDAEGEAASMQVGLVMAESGAYRKHIRAKERG